MVYDYNLIRQAEQDIKDSYWDAMERHQSRLEEWYESEYGDPNSLDPRDPDYHFECDS
ncbi:MAG: hypothetical protein HC924_08440 [Synechococcaceae cyanobacterium SM2_3_2]|nr:hypothetical protein [Synechococcaceae cyanobacterium SM2_3_2]